VTSDHAAHAWWRVKFELRFEQSAAQAFEDFVQEILEHRYPNEYSPVKAAGSLGDKKCDGLLAEQRLLIACYGPEGWDKTKTTAKIESDFSGALQNWDDHFDTWVFTHNQRKGAPPYVHEHLKNITDDPDHGKSAIEWGFARLRALVFELSDEQLTDLLGPPLTLAGFRGVEVRDIADLLRAVENAPAAPLAAVEPVPVDKLERNAFSDGAVELLRLGRRRSPAIGTYFENLRTQPLLRDDIGAQFYAKYQDLRVDGLTADEILAALLFWLVGPNPQPNVHVAGLTVLAYFLDQCDIYEADAEEGPT